MNKSNTISLRLSDEDLKQINELKDYLKAYTNSEYKTSEIIRICIKKTYKQYYTESKKTIND